MKKTRWKIITALFFAISLIGAVQGMTCFEENGQIKCEIPIRVNLEESEDIFELVLSENNIEIVGKNVEVEIKLDNSQGLKKEMELFAYSYIGNKCISCNESRDENILSVELNQGEVKLVQFELEGDYPEESSYKVKYREKGFKTWKEKKGIITKKSIQEVQEENLEIIPQINIILENESSNKSSSSTLNENIKEGAAEITVKSTKDYLKPWINIGISAMCGIVAIGFIIQERRPKSKKSAKKTCRKLFK